MTHKKLCKSHIVPEFMYKGAYDEKHTFIEFNAIGYNKKRRKGIYEYLLCRSCERLLMKYEQYAKLLLYDEVRPYMLSGKNKFIKNDYNYHLLKLFFLSLLWKASVSQQALFKNVSLGEYENELRDTVLNDLAVNENRFPVLIAHLSIDDEPAEGVHMEAVVRKAKKTRRTVYEFIADGFLLIIGVGSFIERGFKDGLSLNRKKLTVFTDQLTDHDSFVELYRRLDKENKFSIYESE